MKKQVFKISGMHCSNCIISIDDKLEDVNGIIQVNTSYIKAQTTIEYDETTLDEQKLKTIIKKIGYKVL